MKKIFLKNVKKNWFWYETGTETGTEKIDKKHHFKAFWGVFDAFWGVLTTFGYIRTNIPVTFEKKLFLKNNN